MTLSDLNASSTACLTGARSRLCSWPPILVSMGKPKGTSLVAPSS